jgi:gluconate 2-dehydrogenase gamma chain
LDTPSRSRRSFLVSTGGIAGATWLTLNWPDIAAAAHHAEAAAAPGAPTAFKFLTPVEATQVEAVAAQIIPSGATAGAREARVVHFIDYALTAVFGGMAPGFREQLTQFQSAFEAQHPGAGGFATASPAQQLAYTKSIELTPFFAQMRFLTVLGFLTSPKYGGNADGLGWKAIGFEDQHVFEPPFGYYDRDYPGFVPYAAKS